MTIEEIENAVLKYYPGINKEDLKTTCKEQKFVQPRVIIWHIARYTFSIRTIELADYYKRNHSTVCRMIFSTDQSLDFNKALKIKLERINNELLQPATC